jgi:UDP-N-acetylmuramyl-tripeptide synthetase
LPQSAELNASHMTTLEANEVQRHLAACRDAGARYAVVEASSIGLDMHRVDQCEFDIGVFTNLTQDHLDYHGTMERYRDAKAELFRMLNQSIDKGLAKAAVLNGDDPISAYMRSQTDARVLQYGFERFAEVSAGDRRDTPSGVEFQACHVVRQPTGEHVRCVDARAPLLGEFNILNCLAAVAVGLSQGVDLADAANALATFPGVPGRMEMVDEGHGFRVIVDIASTEQAMRNVLRVLRPTSTTKNSLSRKLLDGLGLRREGRIIVVFGAAGERDRERRSGIARAVAAGADAAVITNEDPRSESPAAILNEIAAALRGCGWTDGVEFTAIEDRREAIAHAFGLAKRGDTVLLAGKGTEQSIVIGTTHHAWDERAVARELLRERFGV